MQEVEKECCDAFAFVGFADVLLSYSTANATVVVRVGNFELNNMEQTSSSNFVTYTERSAFNQAFINTRRLGVAVALSSKDDSLRGAACMCAEDSGWIASFRPEISIP
jgi:phosphate-selective porin